MANNSRIPELDKLFQQVGTYRKGNDFNELLNFVKKFPKIAPYNAMLVHVQKPGALFVASACDWKMKYGRKPTVGARPLVILRPFGPVAFVFELNETEGAPFPEALIEPFNAKGDVSQSKLDKFICSMIFEGITVVEQDYGTSMAGSVNSIDEIREYKAFKKTEYFNILFCIVLNSNLKTNVKMVTIFHELGHVLCGHVYHPKAKWLPKRYSLSRNEMEFEAESVCWLLCERLGILNPSPEYLAGYLNADGEIPTISIDTVLKAVGTIESILVGKLSPRKELIIGK